MSRFKRAFALLLAALTTTALLAACGGDNSSSASTPASSGSTGSSQASSAGGDDFLSGDPLQITMYYADNATLPFKEDWLTVKTIQEMYNVNVKWEIIPIADYDTKVSLALNAGTNAPDVIMYAYTQGENASLAMNGALVPISDYTDWTPNFNARVAEYGIQEDVDMHNLGDGKRYVMPALYDKPFYDGGLILREDFLEANNFEAPKTYDDLYEILKAYKEENPTSYPLTILAGPRVLYRMTMPAWGISLHKNSASGSQVLSWDYDKKEYFTGAISEQYKEYITFFNKLYAEGLLDPEMADPIDGDKWSQKMASGASIATYAYYDQIGGVAAATEIEGLKLNLYPPLEGPEGAHHQEKSKTGKGFLFPASTANRDDFERVVRTVDAMFYSEEAAAIWCLGVEGTTYTGSGNNITFADDILNSADGVYKYMQLQYGAGSDVTQKVWINEREMSKYDENYREINKVVAGMPDAIRSIPPTPKFDDLVAEDAGSLQTPLADAFDRWNDAFLTGAKSIDTDWDAYVAEMQTLQIEEFCKMYNDNL